MKLILILSLFLIFGKTVSAELSHDDWVGLWIGEGQIGDFPDFGIFSLGDDYLLISSFDGEKFDVSGQTHYNIKRYGSVGGFGMVAGQTMTVEGLNCSVTLQKVQKNTYLSSQDYLLAQSDKDCGAMYAKFSGKYYRFKNSER